MQCYICSNQRVDHLVTVQIPISVMRDATFPRVVWLCDECAVQIVCRRYGDFAETMQPLVAATRAQLHDWASSLVQILDERARNEVKQAIRLSHNPLFGD